ncbi:MAG: type II toxin-antitoxin system HicB family antitoxin [Methylobacter sp.]
MNEIFFIVEDAPEGGYTAKALGESIYTDADNLEELHANVQDAVRCHFDEDKKPKPYHPSDRQSHSPDNF